MQVLETDRLSLDHLTHEDADFIVQLLNEPSFIQNIGDRAVRTAADACQYISAGPVASYERHGFGLYLVVLKESGARIGICGLLKREGLQDVDIGFAFLPAFWSKGYAFESAAAVMKREREVHGLERIVAFTSPNNHGSMKVLEKLGLKFDRMMRLPGQDSESRLFTPAACNEPTSPVPSANPTF